MMAIAMLNKSLKVLVGILKKKKKKLFHKIENKIGFPN